MFSVYICYIVFHYILLCAYSKTFCILIVKQVHKTTLLRHKKMLQEYILFYQCINVFLSPLLLFMLFLIDKICSKR